MKVLLITTHLNIGGIASYLVSLAKSLKTRGYKVIVASSGGPVVEELTNVGITHINLNIKTKSELSLRLWYSLPKLLSLIRKERVEVIHAHTRVTQVLSCLASRLSGVPYITTCHGFFRPRLFRKIFKCWGDKTIAISDAVMRHLVDDFNLPSQNIVLIYNGVDVARFKKYFSQDEKRLLKKRLGLKEGRIIGAIGRLSSVKGYGYLIEAFKSLLDEYRDLQLLIVGDGPEEEGLKDLTKRLGIEEFVKFSKAQPDTAKPLSIIDVFVSSSVQEGLSLSLVEALAAGKPVTATDVGGVSSVIKDGSTGLLAGPEDSQALTKTISFLLKDSKLMDRLAENGRKFVEGEFTIGTMVDKIEEVYKVPRLSLDTNRILIVNVNWLGDVLFTTPFIKAIRKKFPKSYIACMVVPRCKEILEDNPNLDEVIIYDEEREHKNIFGKLKLINNLRRERFDLAFLLHRSFTKALMIFLAGARSRIGYNTKKRGPLLTQAINEPPLNMHKVEYFLNIAKECKIDAGDKDYEFFVNDSERKKIEEFLKDKGVKREDLSVVLNPGGNWPPKRWPANRFAELAERLSNELKAKVIISGALKDSKLAKSIASMSKVNLIDTSGSTSIKSLGALMERADLVVSSDSGPMHLALGVKSKVIALFGPTSDALTGPYGSRDYTVIRKNIGCEIPCYNFNCKDYRCMKAISVEEVFKKVKEMLSNDNYHI